MKKKYKIFEEKPPKGCAACKENEMGICQLTGKEIGVSYVLNRNQSRPRYCPKK